MPSSEGDSSGGSRNETNSSSGDAIRKKRSNIEDYREIARLRQLSAKAASVASKYKTRMKENEAKMVKYTHMAVSQRHKGKMYIEKKKAYESEIAAITEQIKDGGLEEKQRAKLDIKKAKLQTSVAKMEQKSSQAESKAASYTEKATLFQQRAAEFEEKHNANDVDAKDYAARADKLERLMN